ncbi:hypothetical protein DESUT3_04950 [Desulfuromonas versatilis]|uniref:PatA-like N-terminal domain-containing protein n=1 Tax=Desulfuromonas versatilis TaxID=2802975 RepID=A0ABM8HP67_9BACT|nr:DUF4388 domain-containing protein [Desulfuromonas versatilis]BCR03426.1 hypothetical protein DESUT3_04950 [Desulfuromonas versatilis]
MSHIRGDLSLLSLAEIVSGAETLGKTGVLRILRDGVEKRFYFQQGGVVFVTSTLAGERFGEFLADIGCLDLVRMQGLVEESRRRGVRFTYDLLAEKVFEKKALETALSQLVVIALAEALSWQSGTIEFGSELPPSILSGPIHIRVEDALARARQAAGI